MSTMVMVIFRFKSRIINFVFQKQKNMLYRVIDIAKHEYKAENNETKPQMVSRKA